jgi:hypothetical protein
MTQTATIGHNMPPDPIDEALAPFDDDRAEAENWLDGSAVENEAQMKAVDALIKSMKAAKKAVETAEESAAKPLYDAWKAEKARFKPTLDDLDRIVKGLVATIDAFKRKLAAEKEAARKEAERLAWEATRKAQDAAREAAANDIEAQRAAAAQMAAAEDAQRAAMAASKDTVKGLRTYTIHDIVDPRACAAWIWVNDRDAMLAWMQSYAERSGVAIDGVIVRTEKRVA